MYSAHQIICVRTCLNYSPAQDLVFQIFISRMMMAAKWDRSPVSLKMFIFSPLMGLHHVRKKSALGPASVLNQTRGTEVWHRHRRAKQTEPGFSGTVKMASEARRGSGKWQSTELTNQKQATLRPSANNKSYTQAMRLWSKTNVGNPTL